MTEEIRKRLTDLKTRIALESAILMLYEAWFAVVEHFDGIAYSNEDCALILNVPVGLVRLLKEVRNSVEGDFQDRAIALFDKIHVEDDQDNPGRYNHFAQYEKGVIDRWMERKMKEDEWSKQQISKEQAISDFCHMFYMTFGTDIEVREVENPEEIERTFTDSRESTEELESQMRFLVRLSRAGGVDLRQAYLVMNEDGADFADYDNFLRVFDIWAEKEEEKGTVHLTNDEALNEFVERLAREELLVQMFRENAIDEATAIKYLDDPDSSHETFLKLVEVYEKRGDDTYDE